MTFKIMIDGQVHDVAILARRPHLIVEIGGHRYRVEDLCDGRSGPQSLRIDGQPVAFTRAPGAGGGVDVRLDGRTYEARPFDPAAEAAASGAGSDRVRAPMPGAVVVVHKQAGDAVRRGEAIITIESMKLQMALAAPRDGLLAEVAVREGDVFDKDAVLARLQPAAEER
ncbi:acetyl-CoA carboxylase biotin carboxyl carrier protein subunit [Prosthecomicrobium hirschii]|uniref:acetyl-CoA carboxylase biotin carboxyl carrier protein subunit n=1 Tax=Prosthecodimorpha hirschii TaxID=665126 RepID=UPI00221F0AC8|nr:biotin/lipoyl-containing protein [Prosthecomicrobium hirschii]MCW1838945.1 hypothetical protein [Prosthecomicrobium hirschii]